MVLSSSNSTIGLARPDVGNQPSCCRRASWSRKPSEEHRGRVDEDPEQSPAGVHPGVAVAARDQPDRDADDQRDHERRQRQLEGGRSVVDEDRCDGAVVGERRAEVERHRVAQVFEVLGEDRPVVARGLASLLDLLPARRGPRAPPGSGCPGATRISRKTMVSRMRTVGIASASRVSRYVRSEVPCARTAHPLVSACAGRRPGPPAAAAAAGVASSTSVLADQPEPEDVAGRTCPRRR